MAEVPVRGSVSSNEREEMASTLREKWVRALSLYFGERAVRASEERYLENGSGAGFSPVNSRDQCLVAVGGTVDALVCRTCKAVSIFVVGILTFCLRYSNR